MCTCKFSENTFNLNYSAQSFLNAVFDYECLVDLKNAHRIQSLCSCQVDSNLNLILPGAGNIRNPPSSEPELLGFEILFERSVPAPRI